MRMTGEGGSASVRVQPSDFIMNPTEHLMDVLKTNDVCRIRSSFKMSYVDYNYRDPTVDWRTPLMRVCASNNIPHSARRDLAKLLLAKQVDVNTQDKLGLTAMAIVCQSGDWRMVRLLADESEVDPNLADRDGNTPLMHSCRSGKVEVVAEIITVFKKVGLRINEPNDEGVTPLMEAARCGQYDICQVLVQEGQADVNIRDSIVFRSAMDYAVESGRCSTQELVILSPIAQRKLRARQHREAVGFRRLSDVIEDTNPHHPRSDWIKQTNVLSTSRHNSFALPVENAQHAKSMVFQVGKRLQRLTEDVEGESREEAELEEEKRRAPIRRRYSLPSARHCVYGTASSKLHRIGSFHNQTASGTPKLSRGKGKPNWLKLPPVPESSPLSSSPPPTRRQDENCPPQISPPSSTNGLSSFQTLQSPQNKHSTSSFIKSTSVQPTHCQDQEHITLHELAIARSSHIRPVMRIPHTWERRPSNKVPSYLLR